MVLWSGNYYFYTLLAESARSSARLAPLAATLLASLAQNHPCRQASSAHHSHCSLIQRSQHTLLTLLGQTQIGVICPSLAVLAHSAILAYTAQFARTELQMQTGVICPSLALLAHSALSVCTAHFARGKSHTQTGIICPSFVLLAQ